MSESLTGKGKTKTKRAAFLRFLAAVLAALILCAVISLFLSYHGLQTSYYSVSSEKLSASFRVVSLADIHGSTFGRGNKRLIRKVRKAAPDLILLPGDLINKYDEDISDEEALIRELCSIAPVYVSAGNQEREYDRRHGVPYEAGSGTDSVLARFEAAGAVVLDRSYEETGVNGQRVRIGGFYGYAVPEKWADGSNLLELPFLKDFQDTEDFTLLSCHMPYSFLVLQGLDHWDFDAVLCGHVHGGQVRFPFFGLLSKYKTGKEDMKFPYWGGLWAPDQGRFPGRLSGVYTSADGKRTMVLSRGLGNTDRIPRFNNIPEIVVVDYGPVF